MQAMIHNLAFSYLSPTYTHQPMRYVVSRLLRSNKVHINADVLEQKLSGHPYFPSLLSVSDVLNELGIAHQAYRTDIVSLTSNFSSPVLVFLPVQGGMFGVVERLADGKVKVFTEKGETQQYTVEEFSKAWDGVVLELNPAGERKVKQPQSKDAYPAYLRYAVLACWVFIAVYLLQTTAVLKSPTQAILLLFSLAGTSISWLLVLQHLNKNNVLVKQLCESSTNKGCSSVLGSKSAQLTPWLSMAEAGLMFFSGTTLLLLFFEAPVLYFYLAIIAPLMSLYAIYLQAMVLKKWCKLCMGIHGVLLTGFIVTVWYLLSFSFQPGLPTLEQALAFLLPALVWMGVKPFIIKLKEGNYYRKQYRKLKADPDLFNGLLAKQPKIHIPKELKTFSFGNTEAAHELVFVSNPFCGPCGRAHSLVHDWLESDLDFRITIIFMHESDENDLKRQFVERITGIEDKDRLRELLHSWFEEDTKDFGRWTEKHLLEKNLLKYEDKMLSHWLDVAEVKATPTFFVNGRRLPDTYRLEEIRYLVSETNI